MKIQFVLTNVETQQQEFVLHHNPEWSIPFMTISGVEHIWNWDMGTGSLLQNGVPITNYTITIERVN